MKLFLKFILQIIFQFISLIILFVVLRSILFWITDYSLLLSLILSILITQFVFGLSFIRKETQNKVLIVFTSTILILIINFILFRNDLTALLKINSLDKFVYTNFSNYSLSSMFYSNVLIGLFTWNIIFFFIKFKEN